MRTLLHADPARYPRLRQTASYLAATETHTFASSVAAHALLSFFPFIVLLLSLTRNFLHSERLYHSLLQLLRAYLPVSDLGPERTQTFIISNLQLIVEHQRAVQVASLVILLATCTGIFLPLEVALNHIWHAAENRSYLRNWVSAIGLAFSCGVLGMLSASFTSLTETYSLRLYHFLIHVGARQASPVGLDVVSIAIVRAGAVPFTIAMFFLIYWWLPNHPVSARRVLPAAITAGLLWEVSKYVYILMLPWLAFRDIYGPFAISVSLLLWAYVSALILLTCAETVAPISAPEGQRQLDFTVQVPAAATPQPGVGAGVGAGAGTGVESRLAEAAKPRA
ncbi:MAG TPA: YihY/virulence factor BrkB family protein [Terriglobales bacterium]|nr:YihY/virulence factor BrkB family protein [Terriglobales bacterium]